MSIYTKQKKGYRNWAIAGAIVLAAAAGIVVGTSGEDNHPHTGGSATDLVGKPAPDFTLTEANGNQVSLASYRGRTTIVFFTEGLMCYPACWNQIAALGSDKDLNNGNVATVSIVNDMPNEWQMAVKKMPELGTEKMLFDTDKKVSAAYDMLYLASSMHRGERTGHTYVIIDKDGVVRDVWDDPQMGVRNAELKEKVSKI